MARDREAVIGFVNVVWDGGVHAWIQDTIVGSSTRRRGVGSELVARAVTAARAAGCEWLHVDFADHLRAFYFDAYGFQPSTAGLIKL